jgi:26S proteasome regulatory subunit N5
LWHPDSDKKVLTAIKTLEKIVYYIVLSPHENEQSDMLHRLAQDPALAKIELHQ